MDESLNVWGAGGKYETENSIRFIRNRTSGKKKKCQWDQRDHPDGRTIGGSME